jgi:type I restriction enzyme S subunit
MVLRIDKHRSDPRFVHYVLQSKKVRDFIKSHAKGTSPTMKKITQAVVMAIPFPTQCDGPRQADIANRVDTIRIRLQEMENKQTEAARQLDAMLPVILDRAFRGEL